VATETSLGEFVRGRFEELWNHARTRTLESWLHLEVSIHDKEHHVEDRLLGYLDLDDRLFLDATPMSDLWIAHDRSRIRFQLSSPRLPFSRRGFFSFDLVGDSSRPPLQSLREAFEAKYGSTHPADGAARVIMELRPELKISDR
jgi:hypothetical protein